MKCENNPKNKKAENSEITVDILFDVRYSVVTITEEEKKMNAADIVRKVLSDVGISQKKIASKIGLKTQQGFYNLLLAKQGMRIDNFVKVMDALGYDVVVKNRVTDEIILVEVSPCDTDTDE